MTDALRERVEQFTLEPFDGGLDGQVDEWTRFVRDERAAAVNALADWIEHSAMADVALSWDAIVAWLRARAEEERNG